ncbi:unnamed protein product [Acanthoscelides obtectus]|uniref:Uncharacterized protein n=1 Tax=Acanthoscelides obtectus TaxID=200917 RepID=A0A9P0MKY8_ACAOB|nr:unnamed protein product [Acanthoscelides obtectus]CAK1683587.1 hypothetical protein AOBTE_LOCUS34341 [Acanthoscelides obtectus]
MQPWMMQMLWSRMQFRSQDNPGMGPAYHQQAPYHLQGSYQQQYPPKTSLRPPPGFYPPLPLPSRPPSVDTSTPTTTPCPPPSAPSKAIDFYEAYNQRLMQQLHDN